MDDLGESLRPSFCEARPAKTLLINAGMKYGGHFLKKFPGAQGGIKQGTAVAVQNITTRAMRSVVCLNAQDGR
jgi:hypothetical protein